MVQNCKCSSITEFVFHHKARGLCLWVLFSERNLCLWFLFTDRVLLCLKFFVCWLLVALSIISPWCLKLLSESCITFWVYMEWHSEFFVCVVSMRERARRTWEEAHMRRWLPDEIQFGVLRRWQISESLTKNKNERERERARWSRRGRQHQAGQGGALVSCSCMEGLAIGKNCQCPYQACVH